MDMNWIIEQNVQVFRNGGCPKKAAFGILNAIAQSELDTIRNYNDAKIALDTILAATPGASAMLCKMIDEIIQDEGDHCLSAQTAATVCAGIKSPKADEYKEAEKLEPNTI